MIIDTDEEEDIHDVTSITNEFFCYVYDRSRWVEGTTADRNGSDRSAKSI